jgi:serine protease Do
MPPLFAKTSPRILSVLAAGLLMASALTVTATVTQIAPVQAETQQQAIDPSRGFADLVDRVMPAVISVEVKFANVANLLDDEGDDEDGGPQLMPEFPQDGPFKDFFEQFRRGMPQQRGLPRGGVGSGFIISADGYAVTNNHVVQGAEEVTVRLRDGDELKAKVIGTDPKTDLALIKIDSNKAFDFVTFSDKEPRVGDWVMAVGNPFGLNSTVTTGIISARGRDIGSGPYDDFLQIDASINKGNSGGPAFDLEGNVVGVNTAIFSPTGGSVGIGFAIPASTAENVIQSLKDNGAVTRGWLGVQIQPVTDEIAESLGVAEGKGAIISEVTEDSPALEAGLKTGDIILKLDGMDIADSRDLARKVAKVAPGKSVPVEIIRDGKSETLMVAIGKMPGSKEVAAAPDTSKPATLADLGLKVIPADDGAGVTITDVDPDGIAAAQGLRPGDIILEVGGKEVHAMSDVKDALKASGKKRVLMLVRSGDSQRFVALPAGQG